MIVHKAAEIFPSIERSVKNQSELSLKLPEIRNPRGRGSEASEPIIYRDISVNYTDDKRERLRAKLEKLYHVKMPKYKN